MRCASSSIPSVSVLWICCITLLALSGASTIEMKLNIEGMNGQLQGGWTLHGANGNCSTSLSTTSVRETGTGCLLQVDDNALFSVTGSNEDKNFQGVNIVGYATDSGAKDLTTFFGKRKDLEMILRTLDMHYEPKKGVCVIGIDTSSDGSNEPNTLVAAVGASAIIDADSSPGFIYAPKPTIGQNIEEGGSSFITFPNVDVGSTEIHVSPPPGMTCDLGPAGTSTGETVKVDVFADTVSVVSMICH